MSKRKSVLAVLGFLALLGFRLSADAQICVRHGAPWEGCNPPLQPQQCFPVASGPSSWQDPGWPNTWQYRRTNQSPLNLACELILGDFIPMCCGGLPPFNAPGPTISVRLAGTRVMVDYDAPNFYCTDSGDWPPGFTCTNDPFALWLNGPRLAIYRGTEEFPDPGWVAYIYFEHGTWDTGIDVACGTGTGFRADIQYAQGKFASSGVVSLHSPEKCPDRHPCPTAVADPINVGSGDVTVAQQLFTIGQEPLPLPFTLTYHSSTPMFPGLVSSPAGVGWTHEYAQTLRPEDGSNNRLYHITAEGYEHEYLRIPPDNYWIAITPAELRGTIRQVGSEYQLTDLSGTVTSFDVATGNWNSTKDRWGNTISGTYGGGQLTAITDSMGRQIQLSYAAGQVTISLPDASTWKLMLGAGGNLTQIFDPMHTGAVPWRAFSYQNDHAGVLRLLTSVKDDANQELQGYTYEVTTDRGLTSSQAGGTKSNLSIAYTGNNTRTVTHTIDGSTQQSTAFTVSYLHGRWLPAQISGSCATCSGSGTDLQSFTYDYADNVIDKKDGSGSDLAETKYTYDGNGMVLTRTSAVGKPEQRATTYTYNYASGTPSGGAPWPRFVTSMTETSVAKPGQNKTTTFSWNASGTSGTTLTASVSGYLKSADPAPTVYTTTTLFDARHRLTEVDGPATNQKRMSTYYPDADATSNRRGRLQQTSLYTSATAHLDTQYDNFDLFGTARKLVDPNGVETDKTTDPRGRTTSVVSKKPPADPAEPADYTTTYSFDGRDRLTDVTQPRGNRLHYDYEDGTNRLTDTIRVDATGKQQERFHLTLNALGDKVREDAQSCNLPAVSCAAWTTKRTESFKYDNNNRLVEVDHPVPAGSKIVYTYNSRGNLKTVQDERHGSANTLYAYDFLNRLTTVTQKQTIVAGPDVVTRYAYDKQDNLISVTDPNLNPTTYAYDDFRRVQTQTSPVSGATSYSYDPTGNVTSANDTNGVTTMLTYDAANRQTGSTSTRSGFPTETVTSTYDDPTAGAYGKGHLASMTDPSGSSTYAYERRGLRRSESRTIEGNLYSQGFGYDANGNRSAMTYPSGRRVDYTFDFADRPFSVVSGGTTYVSSATYLPFGPETSLQFGNATTKTTSYDLRYRPVENKLAGSSSTIADYAYQEDQADNITQIHDVTDATYNRDFSYDDLSRVTVATTGTSLWGNGSYAYDPMGNLQSLTLGSARTATFSYFGTTPELTSVNETGLGTRSVSYDAAGNETAVGTSAFTYSARNFLSAADGNTYAYDGRGLRTVANTNVSGVAPGVTGINPTSGTTAGGTPVTITGTNFQAGATVSLGGVAATGVTVTPPNSITATTGAHAAGQVNVVVTSPDSQSGTLTNGFTYVTPAPAPTVSAINPTSGTTAGGTPVTITGTNFQTGATVSLGGVAATGVTVTPPDTITATTGAHAAGAVNVVVTNPDTQSGTLTNGFTYVTQAPAPTVTSIAPTSGTTAGGTPVTITGTNFQAGATVSLGGIAATGVTVTPPDTITATTGAHAAGQVNVVVTNPDSQSGTLTNGFSYVAAPPAPTVSSINPTAGTTAGGTPVTIGGNNFQSGATVSLGGVAATGVTVTPPDTITATTGAHAAGQVNVVVTNPDTQTGTLTNGFTYALAPTIGSFTPTSGVTGIPVTINGTNFTGATSVTFNGVAATTFNVVTPIKITATVPLTATTGKIAVTTPGGTATSTGTFTVKPNITGFSPASGAVGIPVTITGSGFSGVTSVKFNGTASTFNTDSVTQITATVPANATTGKITVTTPGGTATSAVTFIVAPRITSFTPANGAVGIPVTITGANLANATSVKFNGTPATITSDVATQIKATVPAGATTGPISVTTEAGTATSAASFTVNITPTISTFSPSSGAVGVPVTINGTYFTGVTAVKFNGTTATITSKTDIQIKANVPANATTGKITVTTPGGTATSATDFTVAPRITGFSPTSGVIGSPVTINGANFTGTTSVKFNGTSATFNVDLPIKITATVPAGATTGKISVTTPAGTATSTGNYTVKPNILNFTPTSGAVGVGVTITGTGFTGATSVKFNGTSAGINSNTGTVIQTSVPANATTGKITATTPGGTATSASSFTVVPRITSFTPTSGAPPTNVTINGANFTGTTSVKFNTTPATFTVSAVKITAPVPAGATTGKISVTTPAGTATSTTNFTVTGALKVEEKSSLEKPPKPREQTEGTQVASEFHEQGGSNPDASLFASRRLQPVTQLAALRLDHVYFPLGTEQSSEPSVRISLFDFGWDATSSDGAPDALGTGRRESPSLSAPRSLAVSATSRRYFFYSPEMSLIAETELTSSSNPAPLYEYIWFNGHPVAQVDAGATTSWTFTDHLGTPILQTSAAQGVTWRAEYEPYGKVYALRTTPDRHQPLRLPGQEAEQLNLGANGATERSYNIFRWYRPEWSRYTQPDPLGLQGDLNLFSYAKDEPTLYVDPTGLVCDSGNCKDCPGGTWLSTGFVGFGEVEIKFDYRGAGFGGHAFGGVYLCLSNPYISVPFITVCTGLEAGAHKAVVKGLGAGSGIGGGPGLFGCTGKHCIEDLRESEDGGSLQIGPVIFFGSTHKNGCRGFGGGFGGGVHAGPDRCRTRTF